MHNNCYASRHKIKEMCRTCQQDNLTDLRRNQSPEREILKMFMSRCCWPFTCRLIFKGMGYYMEGLYDKDKMIQNNLLLTVRSLREYENILPV
jgi:hypothetical protein